MSAVDRPALAAAAAAAHGIDRLLVAAGPNLRWLTGFTGSNGLAVLDVAGSGGGIFLTDFRYMEQSAAQLSSVWEVRQSAQELLGPGLADVFAQAPQGALARVGFDDAQVSVAAHRRIVEELRGRVELVPSGGIIERLREVKEPAEVARVRAAAELADHALLETLERGLRGRTEREVATELEVAMLRLGAEGVSFAPIVAHGAYGALPHAEPRDIAIAGGTLVTIDWGCRLDGYCSDATRTFAGGEIGAVERSIYGLVLEAQEAGLAAVRPGPLGREIDAVAREVIERAGHGEHFGHGLGHGVGLEIHEGPRLSRMGETPLAPGMLVTVEPGVYVPGVCGVRIEDLVCVTETGHDVLNGLPKALQQVD